MTSPYMPAEAEVVDHVRESETIFTLRLRLTDDNIRRSYRFAPGQFNMLYLYGVGEVAISVSSDPHDPELIGHTIRSVGRVTRALSELRPGARVGLRGPYGRAWPLEQAEGHQILVVTGGLGCAPVVAVINYVLLRRERFGRLTIIQGVKHSDDLIWRDRYSYWAGLPNTEVLLSADHGGPIWPWHIGRVTDVFDDARIDPDRSFVMMCGPEGMMRAGAANLLQRGVPESHIFLSMERNMQCAVGHCGHCQFGADFVCSDGPIFNYAKVKRLLSVRGF